MGTNTLVVNIIGRLNEATDCVYTTRILPTAKTFISLFP